MPQQRRVEAHAHTMMRRAVIQPRPGCYGPWRAGAREQQTRVRGVVGRECAPNSPSAAALPAPTAPPAICHSRSAPIVPVTNGVGRARVVPLAEKATAASHPIAAPSSSTPTVDRLAALAGTAAGEREGGHMRSQVQPRIRRLGYKCGRPKPLGVTHTRRLAWHHWVRASIGPGGVWALKAR